MQPPFFRTAGETYHFASAPGGERLERGIAAPGRNTEPQIYSGNNHAERTGSGTACSHDTHERGAGGGGGMAVGTVPAFWKTDDFAGESRRGQDLFCHAACSRLYEPPTSPQHGTAGTIQCDLPDRRGRAGRYGKTPAFGSRRRP